MLRTTLGQLVVNEALPEDLRDYSRVLGKKEQSELLRQVALKHPDDYVRVSKRLSDLGRRAATVSGGNSFGLSHMSKAVAAQKQQMLLRGQIARILNDDKLDDKKRSELLVHAVGSIQAKQMDDILEESKSSNNPLALQVMSGARGNKMNLASLRGGDLLYADHRDRVIPLPVLRSYAEGLSPVEYWAGTYGARKGVLATKFAVRDAGYLGKQTNQIAHRLMVVDDDDPRDTTGRGLPVDTDDSDNEGALLAHDVGGYKRNTVLTPKILKHIKSQGNDRILVRSPIIGGSPDGGVYARDVGVREHGRLPGRYSEVGLTAVQSMAEPLAQGTLSAKHSGGVAGQEKAVGGFAYINSLIQVPKQFKGGAAHADIDGIVSAVEDAPAGGKYVWVDGKRHYVNGDYEVSVKRGDRVEAGDRLSEGADQPHIVTQYKGIGEGRRAFTNSMVSAMRASGLKVHRRNVELLARGLINHVRLTDEYAGHIPDDVVPYSTLEQLYQPRPGHVVSDPRRAIGKYLERPVLHYTIGTRLKPSMIKEMEQFGVKEVSAHNEPPPFEPEMLRGAASVQHDPDWMTRMYGSGQKASLLDAVHRGAVSDELGTSFVPALARATQFGEIGKVRTPEAGKPLPPEGLPIGGKQPLSSRSLFKFSEAVGNAPPMNLAKIVARAQRTKNAADPTGTHQSYTGSSTTTSAGQTTNVSGQSGGVKQPAPTQPKPLNTFDHAQSLTRPSQPQYSMAGAWRDDQVRQQQPKPDGQADNDPYGQYRNAPGYGFGKGLFSQMDDPEQISQFVQGGGFGGDVGQTMRFAFGLNTDAARALTSGSSYAPSRQFQTQEQPGTAMPGGFRATPGWYPGGVASQNIWHPDDPSGQSPVNWLDRRVQDSPQPPVSLPANPIAPPSYGRSDVSKMIRSSNTPESFNQIRQSIAVQRGVPIEQVPEADVENALYTELKQTAAIEKSEYKPGSPKFYEAKLRYDAEWRQKTLAPIAQELGVPADPAAVINALKQYVAANPKDTAAAQDLGMLQHYQQHGFDNDEVFRRLIAEGHISLDSVSDVGLVEQARQANLPWYGDFVRKTTNPAHAAANNAVWSGLKGGYRALRGVPAVPPVVPAAPAVAPLAKATRLGQAARTLGKLFRFAPVIGYGMEAADLGGVLPGDLGGTRDSAISQQEALDRLDMQTQGKTPGSVFGVRAPALDGSMLNYLMDTASNPLTNLVSAGAGVRDAVNSQQGLKTDEDRVNSAADALTKTRIRISNLRQKQIDGGLSSEDAAQLQKLVAQEQYLRSPAGQAELQPGRAERQYHQTNDEAIAAYVARRGQAGFDSDFSRWLNTESGANVDVVSRDGALRRALMGEFAKQKQRQRQQLIQQQQRDKEEWHRQQNGNVPQTVPPPLPPIIPTSAQDKQRRLGVRDEQL